MCWDSWLGTIWDSYRVCTTFTFAVEKVLLFNFQAIFKIVQ